MNHGSSIFSFDWLKTELVPNGLTMIMIETRPSAPLFTYSRFAQELGDGLRRLQIGAFDSSIWNHPNNIQHFFQVYASDLDAAMAFIQQGLKARNLDRTAITRYADPTLEIWRTHSEEHHR